MSREIELDCPSGLRVRLRGIKGKDLDALRDKRKIQTGDAFSKLLDDCTLEVLDSGPYKTGAQVPKWGWKLALVGDRTRALVGLRAATSGQMYGFRVRCQDPDCRAWIDWEVDLMELPLQRLSESSRERFVNGNRFEATVAGKKVTFRLTTGEDQVRAVRFQERFIAEQRKQREKGQSPTDGQSLLALAVRISEVEGESDIVSFLAELDFEDVHALIKSMDAVDCGIETSFEVRCEQCGEAWTTELPLDAKFFQRSSTSQAPTEASTQMTDETNETTKATTNE